jgi:hypothetical protein
MSDKSKHPKKEKKDLPLRPVGGSVSSLGEPNESQFPEPPPSGGQQPGDRIDKAPPTSNS